METPVGVRSDKDVLYRPAWRPAVLNRPLYRRQQKQKRAAILMVERGMREYVSCKRQRPKGITEISFLIKTL